MQGANHWFVAVEQRGELCVSGWNARGRSRAGAKHLCGQTCLYKLVDEFIVNTASARGVSTENPARPAVARNFSAKPASKPVVKTMPVAVNTVAESHSVNAPQPTYIDEYESSARLIPTPEVPGNPDTPASSQDAAASAARNWRAEAWKREREREQNQNEHRSKPMSRRRTFA
ncbi:MAG: hypothetical protein KGN79_04800 [Acidobacteriota bacterium]|nr:hypothetical protein [Acidobacteriota bacterium]